MTAKIHVLRQPPKTCDELQVGDGCTFTLASDSHACTVIKRTRTTIIAQRDTATRVDKLGMTDSGQEYRYTRNPNGQVDVFSRRANGDWKLAGHRSRSPGCYLSAGRSEHYDYSY